VTTEDPDSSNTCVRLREERRLRWDRQRMAAWWKEEVNYGPAPWGLGL
jgi:hypothetical protein